MIVALGLALGASNAARKQSNTISNSLGGADIVQRLAITSNDVIYSPVDKMIYATRPSTLGSPEGNGISRIDPLSAQVVSSTFIGSEPNKLAISDDGSVIYVSLEGSSSLRKFDPATQTAGAEFPLGADNFFGQYAMSDMAVMPGSPNKVVVARTYPGTSPPGAGVALYDNGVRLPKTGPGHVFGANYLAFGSPSVLYGSGYDSGLRTITFDETGITDPGPAPNSPYQGIGAIAYDNGLIYTSTGSVYDPKTGQAVGKFPDAYSFAFVPDSSVGRVFYAFRTYTNQGSVVLIKAFDMTTFVSIGTLTIPDVPGDPVRLLRYGSNGLLLKTADGLYMIQTSLIPTDQPLPTPAGTPAATPTPTPPPSPYPAFIRQVDLASKDLVLDPQTNKLLASIPSSDPTYGNSITEIDPATGAIGSSTFIGSEPAKLELNAASRQLYVSLEGEGAVRRFDLAKSEPGSRIYLGSDYSGLFRTVDIASLPGSPDTIAISHTGGISLFDGGVQRGPTANLTSAPIEFRNSQELIAGGSSYNQMKRFSVTADGLTMITPDLQPGGGSSGDIKIVDDLLYFAWGRVYDLPNQKIKGVFTYAAGSSLVVDKAMNRVYFLSNSGQPQIRAFALDTMVPVGSIALPPGLGYSPATSLMRWGANGLAFRDDNKIYLIQSKLLDKDAPVPNPTPTPSPTPLASPTPSSAFVREVPLPANDIVYNPGTKRLYASVPSSAGATRGNTITSLDPATGEIGQSTFVGSEPNRLAMSDDNKTLYARLDGASGAIKKFDMQTQLPGPQVAGPPTVMDMKVMPGSPQTLAYALGYDGVSLYDNGVIRGSSSRGSAYGIWSIDFADPNTIYGYDNYSSGFELIKFAAGPAGLSASNVGNNLISGYGVTIKYSEGLIYSSGGRVLDPQTQHLAGTFQGAYGPAMEIDPTNQRFFLVSNNTLSVYDLRTYKKLGAVPLPQIDGTGTKLVRWGDNGLAMRTTNGTTGRLFLIQSPLVNATAPVPVGFSLPQTFYYLSEDAGALVVTVYRTGDPSRAVSVNYATEDGTATAGTDYVQTKGSLTFAAGENIKTVPIQILNDNVFETTKEFTFNLTSTGSQDAFVVPSSSTKVTLYDNDARPSISGSNISVVELRAGSSVLAQVPIKLSNPSTETVTVQYSTANGTATSGIDYVATAGTLTFEPLETQKFVPVVILGDNVPEPNETFSINLSVASNGYAQAPATVTIINFNARQAPFDYDADGRSDVAIYRPENGVWNISASQTGFVGRQFGSLEDKIVPADFDGDGRTDVAVFRPSNGMWYLSYSATNTYGGLGWGNSSDVPVPADFDGDGKADVAIFRPTNGTWWINQTAGGGTKVVQYGQSGDLPAVGDYDGDGKADIAVFRPSAGTWSISRSTAGEYGIAFGQNGDKVVPGDYNGDGKTDVAVFRPSNGVWYIANIVSNTFSAVQFGTAVDIPAPGDYDGDGKTDPAVFRSADGNWWINRSGGIVSVVKWGQNGDIPTSNAFVY